MRVTPRASREAFGAGAHDGFAAKLTAPPVDGAANAALVTLVARRFGVAKRDVTIVGGETARAKRVAIAGDPEVLAARAATLYGAAA